MVSASPAPDATVIELSASPLGRHGDDSARLRYRLVQAACIGLPVVIDCSAVRLYSAAFLGVLVSALHQAGGCPGDFVLCGVSDLGREVFQITHLDTRFPNVETREEALEASLEACVPLIVEPALD